jgi:glycosyltransferase involved in cell wall biosynthesis
MNKKLLIIGNNSIHIYNYIELVKNYFDNVLLLTPKKNNNFGINNIEVNFGLRKHGYKNYKNLKKIIENFKPNIVHIHQVNTPALLTIWALKNYNVKKVLTAWGSDILINPKKSLWSKWRAKYILNNIDVLTADSNIVLTEAQKLIKKKIKAYNVNFGVDIVDCNIKKENIIYSNRLHKPLYNIDKIILSFSKFLSKNKNWKLVIAGNGSETNNLKNLCKKLNIDNNVEFIGWVDKKTNFEYYCKSKIYVSIPSSDSVSLSLVEAIIAGCVVYVSDLPANHEIVNSNIGFIVKDKENIDFEKYLDLDKKKFEKERQKIKKYFSKEFNRKKFINIYNSLLNEN